MSLGACRLNHWATSSAGHKSGRSCWRVTGLPFAVVSCSIFGHHSAGISFPSLMMSLM